MNLRLLAPFFSISLFLHGILFINFLIFDGPSKSPHQFKLVRVVGEKTGKQNLIAKQATKSKPNSKEDINLSDLNLGRYSKGNTFQFKKKKLFNQKFKVAPNSSQLSAHSLPQHRKVVNFINNSDVNMQFHPPKGVKEDQLNKLEQIIYSFQKRVGSKYYNSFLLELLDFRSKNIKQQFPTENREYVSGRITFDSNGDIVRINTLQWSENPQFQTFFMDLLKRIDSIPNPPKLLLSKNQTFDITFTLKVN